MGNSCSEETSKSRNERNNERAAKNKSNPKRSACRKDPGKINNLF